jgi:hypothetical protein
MIRRLLISKIFIDGSPRTAQAEEQVVVIAVFHGAEERGGSG